MVSWRVVPESLAVMVWQWRQEVKGPRSWMSQKPWFQRKSSIWASHGIRNGAKGNGRRLMVRRVPSPAAMPG